MTTLVQAFRNFVSNPFQKTFLPTLVAIVAGVASTAVDHGAHRLVPIFVWTFLAIAGIYGAGKPLTSRSFWLCVLMSAMWSASAIMMVFAGAWLAFAFAAIIALYPTMIVVTRKREEETPSVQ